MCLKTYTKLNGRVGFSLKMIIAILTRVCFMRKLTLNISNIPIPILAVSYANIISSNWQQINALSLYCIISCCISIGDCMKSTFSDRECWVTGDHFPMYSQTRDSNPGPAVGRVVVRYRSLTLSFPWEKIWKKSWFNPFFDTINQFLRNLTFWSKIHPNWAI